MLIYDICWIFHICCGHSLEMKLKKMNNNKQKPTINRTTAAVQVLLHTLNIQILLIVEIYLLSSIAHLFFLCTRLGFVEI